jgi:hypothetical protein
MITNCYDSNRSAEVENMTTSRKVVQLKQTTEGGKQPKIILVTKL